MSRYYDDDEDDNPYAPRIGPAAMPSPRSKFAPYYSGHANTFEDFLEEFEGLASDCELTDPQRVDVLIRYVAPSLRDFWRSLSGYHSRDWPLFRQSLVNIFGNTTPRHQILRQKLHSYIQDSSRRRMFCEDDVLRYYRQFICFGLPLVHAGHLSGEERDAAFWYGFHPDDRQILQPRLLGKNHFQPPDIPFHFEDVLGCARAAFAYEDSFSPWLHAKQFKPPIVRREQHIVEPAPRDAHSCRAVTRAVATYAETTPNELSPSSHSTPDTQLPSSSSPSALESQHGLAHSATLDQPEPEPEHTLSTTLQPSASFPTSFHTHSPAPSAIDDDFELTFTPPAPSVSSIDVECLRSPATSATDCQSESEPASTSESPVSKFSLFPRMLSLPPDQTLAPLSSSPLREISSLGSLPVAPSPDQPSLSLVSLSQLSRSCELESSTPVSAADVVTLSHPELSLSSLGETIPLLPAQDAASVTVPTSRRSTPPQRLPEVKTFDSDSSATPFVSQSQPRSRQPLLVYEVSSTLAAPRLSHPSPLLPLFGPGYIRFNFALALVTAAVLASILNISATSTFAHKYWSKYEDFGNNRNGIPEARNIPAQRLRLGQFTPRASRFVFDPGGPASSSSFKLLSAHEDIRQRKSKTRIGFITTRRATLLAPILANNLIVFNPGVAFMLDPAHEDPATFNEDPR
ncbi:hypothetical protein EDB89DRAFT_2085856 [Lactarius sanguifluus]|nr:hypothetical protein EDB89DRAFT_2085856 [Lactarius sanguifluus]